MLYNVWPLLDAKCNLLGYRRNHSICYTCLFTTPLVVITISLIHCVLTLWCRLSERSFDLFCVLSSICLFLNANSLFLWGALSDERTGLSFEYAAGPCQRRLSRVRVPWVSRPYFTVSDLRLPFSSPPTTRRVTVEVFDPASTNFWLSLSLMLRPMVSRPVCLGIKHQPGAYDQIFITVGQLRVCWCGALSLMRGRVCRLQLLLALASAVEIYPLFVDLPDWIENTLSKGSLYLRCSVG
jgi:hypothetical protein